MVRDHGFELDDGWGHFVRRQSYGHDAMLIVNQGSARFGPRHFEIGLPCEIRHDLIEVPWNTLGLVYGEENQLRTPTLVLGFPRGMQAKPPMVALGWLKEDIARAAKEAEDVFLTKALPFYERFADLRAIEKLANEKPLADLLPYTVGGPIEDRAMRSLLLAKAVNPERYALVRETFVTLDKGMFPREKRLEMLRRVDEMELAS